MRAERRAVLRSASNDRPTWALRFDLKEWQKAALAAWTSAGRTGVVEAATGTGKTAVALAAIEALHRELGDQLRVAIVVPTKVLADQWREQLERSLGLLPSWIGEQHSDAQIEWTSRHAVLVTVVDTARNSLVGVLSGWQDAGLTSLLVVDECHRAGSEFNSSIFNGQYDFSIGLSATPERDDRGHLEFVYPGVGQPVYRYPLLAALDDGVLAPVTSVNLYVDFNTAETAAWDQMSKAISKAIRRLKFRYPELENVESAELFKHISRLAKSEDLIALAIVKALSDRKELLALAHARLACQRSIVDWLAASHKRALIFHESIVAAEATYEMLRDVGVVAGLDHSQLDKQTRRAAMDQFRHDRCQVLVAVRALDEGIDVPDASVAVIAAGSRSRRQRIQRFGRVLRPAPGKRALVLTILVRNTIEETAVGGRDSALVGVDRVRHHRWPAVAVDSAATMDHSTYAVTNVVNAVEDIVTLVKLGLWEPEMQPTERCGQSSVGGFSARQEQFSVNAWHAAEDVRSGIGMPSDVFDKLRAGVRRTYRLGLDPTKRQDGALIHGSEIQAVRREWRRVERLDTGTGRRR